MCHLAIVSWRIACLTWSLRNMGWISASRIGKTVMKKNTPPSPFGYLLIIGIFLVGLVYLVGALQEWQVSEYLRQHGTLIEATIVEHSEQFRNFYIKYSFMVTTPSGEAVTITRRESTNMFYYSRYLKYTDKVSILYTLRFRGLWVMTALSARVWLQ